MDEQERQEEKNVDQQVVREGEGIRGTVWAAGDGLDRARSLSELKARVYALFRRIDQELVGTGSAQGVETNPALDRFWRGRAVQWSQRG